MAEAWADRILIAGGFFIAYGAYLLFMQEPARDRIELLFRIIMLAIGIILGGVGLALRAIRD